MKLTATSLPSFSKWCTTGSVFSLKKLILLSTAASLSSILEVSCLRSMRRFLHISSSQSNSMTRSTLRIYNTMTTITQVIKPIVQSRKLSNIFQHCFAHHSVRFQWLCDQENSLNHILWWYHDADKMFVFSERPANVYIWARTFPQ